MEKCAVFVSPPEPVWVRMVLGDAVGDDPVEEGAVEGDDLGVDGPGDWFVAGMAVTDVAPAPESEPPRSLSAVVEQAPTSRATTTHAAPRIRIVVDRPPPDHRSLTTPTSVP
jgi:hypothetical protein